MWHPCFTHSMCCAACHALAQAPSVQPGRQPRSRQRTLGRVLKAAVLDGAQQLGLEQEVLEAAAVDAHVALLHLQQKGKRSASMVLQASPRTATQACAADKGAHCRGCKTVPFAPGRPPWRPRRPWPPRQPPHSQAAAIRGSQGCSASVVAAKQAWRRRRAAGGKRRAGASQRLQQRPAAAGSRCWPAAGCDTGARAATGRAQGGKKPERGRRRPAVLPAAASHRNTRGTRVWDSGGPARPLHGEHRC